MLLKNLFIVKIYSGGQVVSEYKLNSFSKFANVYDSGLIAAKTTDGKDILLFGSYTVEEQ